MIEIVASWLSGVSCLTFPLENLNLPASGVVCQVDLFHLYVLGHAKTEMDTFLCAWFLSIIMKIIGPDQFCAAPNPMAMLHWPNVPKGRPVPTYDLPIEGTLLPIPRQNKSPI